MFDELKPCPFCGGEAHLFVNDGVRVFCPKCGGSTKVLVDGLSSKGVTGNAIKAVIEAWNRREGFSQDNAIPNVCEFEVTFPPNTMFGTVKMNGETFQAYLGEYSEHTLTTPQGESMKRKFTIIEA